MAEIEITDQVTEKPQKILNSEEGAIRHSIYLLKKPRVKKELKAIGAYSKNGKLYSYVSSYLQHHKREDSLLKELRQTRRYLADPNKIICDASYCPVAKRAYVALHNCRDSAFRVFIVEAETSQEAEKKGILLARELFPQWVIVCDCYFAIQQCKTEKRKSGRMATHRVTYMPRHYSFVADAIANYFRKNELPEGEGTVRVEGEQIFININSSTTVEA